MFIVVVVFVFIIIIIIKSIIHSNNIIPIHVLQSMLSIFIIQFNNKFQRVIFEIIVVL